VNLEILEGKQFTYQFGDRVTTVTFENLGNQTEVVVVFDPENENPIELQQTGWQMILNNFKNYTENENLY
jgi:hypothetical protein